MAASPTRRETSGRELNGAEDGGGVTFAKEPSRRGSAMALGESATRSRSRSNLNAGGMNASAGASRRMSMPQQHRQTSMVLSPSRARGRTTSGAGMGGNYDGGVGYEDEHEDDDDDDEDRVHNLTFDGVKEGPYMLCKRSDDLLGHHARQVFREKAASMRGENSIYYYLKDLMKKFGSAKIQKKGLTSEQIVLEPHEFRKLIASDAAFQSAIPEEQIDALFHRLEHDNSKLVRHLDFVEFCLFDHHQLRLLLFKFRKRLKKMRLTDNEITDTFRRLTSSGGTSVSSELLHAAVARELDVVLTTGELRYLLQLMDLDCDGTVKVNDFEVFVKDDRASFDLVHPPAEYGVVDLKLSVNEVEEANLKREGFKQLHPALHDDRVHLWYKTAPREEGKSAITNIRYAPSARDSDLVAKGYTCLQQDVNRSGAFGKHKYIWLSYVPPNVQSVSEIIDVCLSSGEQDDKKDAKLWLPMHRGFKLVPGDLNDRSTKLGVFMWIRRRPILAAEDLADASPGVEVPDSPRASSKMRKQADELEAYVRQTLRRNCPVEQDGSINFARLFDEFDQKKSRAISKQAMHAGVESFGIKMKLKDFPLVWDRINPCAKKAIDVATLSEFLEMTEAEIDDIVNSLQRSMTTKSTQQQQMPNYRLIFQSYNSLGDGRLSRSDFQRLLAGNQINFTNAELSKIIQRFDVNKDGVVDYSDFLRYVTGICDAAARRAQRVANAAEDLKTWAMEKQNKKLAKDGQIDSSSSWKLLRPKRGLADLNTIDHVLRERSTRLDSDHLRLLRVLIAPATNGEINQATYHEFVNHQPKKLSTLVYDLKKIAGPTPEDGAPDGVYDRLNTEGNGRLSLVSFAKETNTFASEKSCGVGPFDLKDFVYVVQWTGADCGGDGAVLIDRFLSAIRENNERRNMKHEYVTNYDSPAFIEGVKLLRDEMRRCAKTPDGKFNYRIPFQLFDKDKSGQIVLSEFEAAVRELGVDKFLTDQEVKSLMRRFDLNSTGGVSYDEFLRFNVVDTSSTSSAQAASVEPILCAIVELERLTASTIGSFCSSIKRMFSILDKDTHGVVPVSQFVQTLRDMGISLADEHMEALAHAFMSDDSDGGVGYGYFCEALQRVCERSQNGVNPDVLSHEPAEVVALLCSLYREHHRIQRAHAEIGKPGFDLYKAFGISHGEKQRCVYLSPDELKEVLWASGSRHPFLREELESILRCFHSSGGGFNASTFCQFMDHGPVVLFQGGNGDSADKLGVLDGYVSRLQDGIQTYLAAGGRNAEERLFECFSEFDDDGSGTISQEEFVHVLHKAGLRRFLSPDDESLLLQFLDSNGDGVISYKEFVEFTRHGEERLNTLVDHEHEVDLPPPRSPGSPRSRPPTASPPRSPPRPQSPSFSAKASSPAKSNFGSPRLPPRVMLQIAKLNSKLRPEFPFDKYFHKYRHSSTGDALVKSRVFEKIMDKFLARLVEHNIAYNMQELDADVLTRGYESASDTNNGAAVVRYDAFLNDLRMAQSRAAAERWKAGRSDSSDDDHGDLSCSSDEGASKTKRLARVNSVVTEAIRREHKSKQDFEALRAKVKTALADIEKSKKEKVSEGRIFKMMAGFGLRLKKKEAETLLRFIASTSSGSKVAVYDSKQLGVLLNDQLGGLLGETKKPDAGAPSSQVSSANAAKKDSASGVINAALADKIYRCFIAAAQLNISGRKLLEKCDTQKSGLVTLLELQTVLRLMGCVLADAEVNEIKTAFAGPTAGTINYRVLVRQLTKQLQPSSSSTATSLTTTSASTAAKLQEHRPTPIQIAPMPPAKALNDYPHKPPASTATATSLPPPRPLTMNDIKRLDTLLRPYFQDLLTTRRIDTQSLLRSFEPYDMKGTGFVTPDAVYSVMRKYDIWLPDDMARNVLQRYASASSGRFDYVEFSTSLGASGSKASSLEREESREFRIYDEARAPKHSSGNEMGAEMKALPDLDRKAQITHATRNNRAHSSAPAPVAVGWSCPVCLHTQRNATTVTCEICAAQNPASVEYETLLKCAACEFRNRANATHCDLCRLPLVDSHDDRHEGTAPSSPQKPHSKKPSNLTLQIPSTSTAAAKSYDEGWLA